MNYNDNDIFRSNHYVEHFNDCFDILNQNDRFNFISMELSEEPVEKKKGLFKKRKLEEVVPKQLYNESKNDVVEEFDNKIDEFIKQDFEPVKGKDKNITRSFEQMWYFAQFVRYAEKVVFYSNDTTKPIFVDSPLDEDHERIFVITKDNYELKFKLQWIYDTTAKQMIKVINIKVSRSFGKEMTNEYIIVDGNVKLNDVSDFTLISVINSILFDATLDTYKQIMNCLFTFFEERMLFPCPL